MTSRIFDVGDVGTLFLLLRLVLECGGEIAISDIAATGRLPDRELPLIPNLAETLRHLAANGFLRLRVESGTACIYCGPRVRELCRKRGLALPV